MDTRSTPRLIAFNGPAGVGKSAAAEFLCGDEFAFVRVKFAEGLKAMLRALYECAGLDPDEIERRIEGDLKEKPDPLLGGKSPRHAMLTLGTDWGRDLIAPGLWVRIWSRKVRLLMASGHSVVVDDLRFPNELAEIRELGGEVYQVTGPSRRGVTINHVSEQLACDPDGTIVNNDDLVVFYQRIADRLGL